MHFSEACCDFGPLSSKQTATLSGYVQESLHYTEEDPLSSCCPPLACLFKTSSVSKQTQESRILKLCELDQRIAWEIILP